MSCVGTALPLRTITMSDSPKIPDQTSSVERSEGADEWLTTKEVAEELQIHPETVRRWIRDGSLPAHRPPTGRALRIRRSDLAAIVEQGRERPGSPFESSIAVPGDRVILISE